MPRLRFILALCLAWLATPASAAALTIDAAAVTFNPKKTDSFAIKGRVDPFDVAGIAQVTVDFGSFRQTVPRSAFTAKKGTLSFKGPKGAPGLAALTIDTVKGKFAAAGKNLTLAPFENPTPFRLAAGAHDECSTLTFAEVKSKWKLARSVPACGFVGNPQATPTTLTVGIPTDVRVRVGILDDLALDLGSLVVLRLDDALNPTGQMCTLHDDGSPAHGDDTAVDGTFSCRFQATESAPTRLRFAVQVLRDTVLVLSASFFVDVVTPLTDAEIATVQATHDAALDLWEAALAEYGEGKKARKQTVLGILALPGVADAGVAGDGVNIFIDFASGLAGGLDLDPVATDLPELSTALAARASAASVSRAAEMPTPAAGVGTTTAAIELSAAGPRIGNNKVLIWSPFENETGTSIAATAAVWNLFETSTCPDFDVKLLKNEQCDLASIATFQDYGTVVVLTHGGQPKPKGPIGFMSREKATTFSTWYTHAEDLKLKRVLVYRGARTEKHDYFVFFPSFVRSVATKQFPNSIVFAGACSSGLNRSMANAFFGLGALSYFGFSDVSSAALLHVTALSAFQNLLQPAGSSVADAYARVPHKTLKQYLASIGLDPKKLPAETQNTLASKLLLLHGDARLGYPCGAPPAGLVETITVPAGPMAHAVGSVVLQSGVPYHLVISGTLHNQAEGNAAEFSDYDGIYCFESSSGFCNSGDPFPNEDALYLYSQAGTEEPGFGSLESVREFTGASPPPYSDAHVYEFPFTGKNGKLWVALWPQFSPTSGVELTGAITVQILRD